MILFARFVPWIVAGLLVVIGIQQLGLSRAETRNAQAKAEHARQLQVIAEQHDRALQAEISAHNATQTRIEAIHAEAEQTRAIAQEHAASAAAAGDRAARSERRLRDAIATTAVIASAADQPTATPSECQAAAEAARVLADVLGRLDATAGRIGAFALASSRFADQAAAAATECERISDALRVH